MFLPGSKAIVNQSWKKWVVNWPVFKMLSNQAISFPKSDFFSISIGEKKDTFICKLDYVLSMYVPVIFVSL